MTSPLCAQGRTRGIRRLTFPEVVSLYRRKLRFQVVLVAWPKWNCMKRKQTYKAYANSRWFKILDRAGIHPNYVNVEVRFTKAEFYAWISFQWPAISEMLKEKKEPSIDRIDPQGHYEFGNMRIIPLQENRRLGLLERNRRRSERLKQEHPPKPCLACGKLFTRKLRPSGIKECYPHFRARKTCNAVCADKLRERDEHGRII